MSRILLETSLLSIGISYPFLLMISLLNNFHFPFGVSYVIVCCVKDDQLCHKLLVMHLKDSVPAVILEDAVKTVRPHIVCCIVPNVSFTTDSFKKFIQLQVIK